MGSFVLTVREDAAHHGGKDTRELTVGEECFWDSLYPSGLPGQALRASFQKSIFLPGSHDLLKAPQLPERQYQMGMECLSIGRHFTFKPYLQESWFLLKRFEDGNLIKRK